METDTGDSCKDVESILDVMVRMMAGVDLMQGQYRLITGRSNAALDELTQLSQEMGLYDEIP